jgi:hypothetical protein
MRSIKKHMDTLCQIYEQAEALKLKTWYALERVQDDLEWYGDLKPEDRMIDAEATYDEGILRVVVKDCLPRRPSFKPVIKSASLLRSYWVGNITSAIRRLPEPVKYEKAICIINIITPKNIEWDVDNRAINMIVNSLRMTQVIPNDSWDKLSLCVFGGVDKDNPRTEITVVEQPDNPIPFLVNGREQTPDMV